MRAFPSGIAEEPGAEQVADAKIRDPLDQNRPEGFRLDQDHRIAGLRPSLPDLAEPRRLGCDESGPRLFGRLCRPRHRYRRACRPRPDVHHRPRQRDVLCRRSRRSAPLVVGLELDWISEPIPAASGGTSPATASCAGSARTRARCTLRPARWSTRCGTCWAKAAGKPVWQLVADMTPEEIVAHRSTSAI